jgi:nitrogen fixation NifU-like protein
MSELSELYHQVILDHGRNPRGAHLPQAANCAAEGHNPLCGDRVSIKLRREGDVVADVGFEGSGCAISTAAASIMTEAVRGKTVSEVRELSRRFRDLVTGKADAQTALGLGKLAAFGGVSEFPMRVKCATLAWHTLEAALDGQDAASIEEQRHD